VTRPTTVRGAPEGRFDLIVSAPSDPLRPAVKEQVEQYNNLSLDPDSSRYIETVIEGEVTEQAAASNYVEVATQNKTHLARSTLAAIERQRRDAGARAIRVHRSYVVNADHIREITPTGEGDVKIELSHGAIIPGSRRYRDRLQAGT